MKNHIKRAFSLILVAALTLALGASALAATARELDAAIEHTAQYIHATVKVPQVDSVGGEWAIIGLARSGYDVPDTYYETYYKTVEAYVRECDGVLHEKKYTEYSRVIIALTAAGYDPREVAGYDLTVALGDFERTIWQGINGPIWALIALDSADYAIPANADAKTQATRELYIAEILRRQLSDGGWNLTAGANGAPAATERANADLTGMALQALARYKDTPDVAAAIDKALACLSKLQNTEGGYDYAGDASSESVVQVLVALMALGIDENDARFVKNGKTVVDNILSYANDDGSFRHTGDGSGNSQMSTEQAFYGLVAAQRQRDGESSLYDMSDVEMRGEVAVTQPQIGLVGKHADVRVMPVTAPSKTFGDVAGHANRAAIDALASRGIINGKTDDGFVPDATMTRAEFATIITRGLGLTPSANDAFADVKAGDWFAAYVGTANAYGIVSGVGEGRFNPQGTITRQEAAVMVARAAKLAGLDTELDDVTIRDTLAQFGDYKTVASWAQSALAFCYSNRILDDSELDIQPTAQIYRCEIAEMLWRMLSKAELLK